MVWENVIGNVADGNNYAMIVRNYLSPEEANNLFHHYLNTINFIQGKVKVYGKTCDTPRVQYFMGDDHVKEFNYSRVSNAVYPWDQPTRSLRDRVQRETVHQFDSALLNYYRNDNDYIAYHMDAEVVNDNGTIIVIALGSTRRFYFKNNETNFVVKTEMRPGDCLVVCGDINQKWKHSVPKQKGVGPRISITFRRLVI